MVDTGSVIINAHTRFWWVACVANTHQKLSSWMYATGRSFSSARRSSGSRVWYELVVSGPA